MRARYSSLALEFFLRMGIRSAANRAGQKSKTQGGNGPGAGALALPLWAPGATCRQQQSSATNSALFASLRKGQMMQNSLQKGARQKRTTLYAVRRNSAAAWATSTPASSAASTPQDREAQVLPPPQSRELPAPRRTQTRRRLRPCFTVWSRLSTRRRLLVCVWCRWVQARGRAGLRCDRHWCVHRGTGNL
jgi:hypothetical protein